MLSQGERALLERAQQHDELALRARQAQQTLDQSMTPGQRRDLERLHLQQRLEQRALHERQLRQQAELVQSLRHLPQAQQRSVLESANSRFARERAEQEARRPPLPPRSPSSLP